jgi:hypothetical protein
MSAAHSLVVAALALAFGTANVQAQVANKTSLSDTIIVTGFGLVKGGPSPTPYLLKTTRAGKAPSHYRVSAFSTFKDAVWTTWPSSNMPAWNGSPASGACGPETIKIVGYLQLRAVKTILNEGGFTFVSSNVVRDSMCVGFG